MFIKKAVKAFTNTMCHKVSDTTKKNATYLCAHICKLLGIAAGGVDTYVVRHYDVTHKNCPAQMAGSNNDEWNSFKERVKSILNDSQTSTSATKTVAKKSEEIAKEVLDGKWGNGGERKRKLEAAGYNYTQIQTLVNKLCK
jgi:N-acetylmuramoyl-L-alanine amidase CwlA